MPDQCTDRLAACSLQEIDPDNLAKRISERLALYTTVEIWRAWSADNVGSEVGLILAKVHIDDSLEFQKDDDQRTEHLAGRAMVLNLRHGEITTAEVDLVDQEHEDVIVTVLTSNRHTRSPENRHSPFGL